MLARVSTPSLVTLSPPLALPSTASLSISTLPASILVLHHLAAPTALVELLLKMARTSGS